MTESRADYSPVDRATGAEAARVETLRQKAWLKAGALQDAILNSANFSIIATDEKGVIQLFNVGAERMLGYAAADMVNLLTPTHFSEPLEVMARAVVLSRENAETIAPGFEALVFKATRGIEDIYEQTCIRKDGSRFSAIVSVTSLRDADGHIIGFLLIGTDNSERKQVEEQLRVAQLVQAETQRKHAKLASQKAALAQYDYVSAMSQELRNPLNTILGFAQLMASDSPAPSASQKESIAQILQAGWYQMELIDEVLDLAMVESGCLSWTLEPLLLSDAMRECQLQIEPQAQKRGVRVAFPDFDQPCFVSADRTRLQQVLMKLLSNAVKYNQAGGSVVVELGESEPQRVRLRVWDTGTGLSPDQMAQLFQPFHRLGQQAGTEQGAGIGLVVTKRLVELMGGAMGVESTVGQGSVFWIELAVAAAPAPAMDAGHLEPAPAPEAPIAVPQRTVLYVEDNAANLQLVEQIIARRPGMRLLSARNATLGIELAQAAKPDLILMDINLPGISGIEAMQMLRADPQTAHIPVVALSANAIARDIERGLEAGFFRYLTKPIRVNEFLETLDVALEFALCAPSH